MKTSLFQQLSELKHDLEKCFSPETSNTGLPGKTPSAGHCAVVAFIINKRRGAKCVSTKVNGDSHWFNRIPTEQGEMDFDITGDQFGLPSVQIAKAGELYPETRERNLSDVNEATKARALALETKLLAVETTKN